MMTPKRVPNDHTGHCDNCGIDLKAFKWIMADSTGCTKWCVREDYNRDLAEFGELDDEDLSNDCHEVQS